MSDTYTKLFRSIAASTIVSEPLATRWLWVTLLSQCDRTGTVYGSIPGLARMANITLPEVEDALQRLHAPDAYSRTKDHEGRRLETIDGGWRLLNYAKYDAMRNEAERREAKREWDRQNRPSGWKRAKESEPDKPEQSDDSPTVRQEPDETRQSGPMSHVSCPTSHGEAKASSADADVSPAPPIDAAEPLTLIPVKPPLRPACPHSEIVGLYHETLPALRRVRDWTPARQKFLARRWAENPERQSLDWWRGFFAYVAASKFLTGKSPGRDGRTFDCDLEWLVRPQNFTKVIEGKYEDEAA